MAREVLKRSGGRARQRRLDETVAQLRVGALLVDDLAEQVAVSGLGMNADEAADRKREGRRSRCDGQALVRARESRRRRPNKKVTLGYFPETIRCLSS